MFDKMVDEVGGWSLQNFGLQFSKVTGVLLGPLAPLMGIAEEVGELVTAVVIGDTKGVKDAIGDVLIYLCDYSFREGVSMDKIAYAKPTCIGADATANDLEGLSMAVGALFRATLKRHQGIRDHDKTLVYLRHRDDALERLVLYLDRCRIRTLSGNSLFQILEETWNGIVAKRDWKKDATGGGGHTHHNRTGEEVSQQQDPRTWPDGRPVLASETREFYGSLAYKAYCDSSGGRSLVSGERLPAWELISPAIRAAWCNAAHVAREAA